MHCERHLPKTGFNDWPGNPIEKIFWGRVKLASAGALYFFDKGEKVQKLMHGLKYRGRKDIGLWMGNQLGLSLLKSGRFNHIDYVVPIPLHPKKKYQRGFNQSDLIGQGIEKSTGWVFSELLERTENTESQTRKTKFERWKNVSGKFSVIKQKDATGYNILLIDDIVTTGATLESTAGVLLDAGAKNVSVATIAVA
jgi:ComF family protein